MLLDAINRDNGLTANPLTLNEIGMGLPTSTGLDTAFYNTYLILYGLYGKGYFGSVQISYQRYLLSRMFRGLTPLVIANPSPTKHSDLLPLLNDLYGLGWEASDIVDQAIPAGTESAIVTITMKPTNWAWIGSLTVRFAKTLPYISDELTNSEIDAINPGMSYQTKPLADYLAYGYDWTGIAATLTDAGAGATKPLTQAQFDQITTVTTTRYTMASAGSTAIDQVSLANAVWGGVVRADSDPAFNSTDYTYVNTLILDAASNYAGRLIFHFNTPTGT
jgi:hypothetical protein